MTYKAEKDKILNCWIVWEVHTHYYVDVLHKKTKKECVEWIKKQTSMEYKK